MHPSFGLDHEPTTMDQADLAILSMPYFDSGTLLAIWDDLS